MYLCCPVCNSTLKKVNKSYRCEHNHTFDVAKEGYTNLLLKSSKHTGDNKEMVVARHTFLSKGFYNPLLERLLKELQTMKHDVLVDCGCGEGFYTNHIQQALKNQTFAFDVSKDALKYASKNNKDINYFLASIFHLPIKNESVDVIFNIFAPCPVEEVLRLLKPDGYLIKVDPDTEHLKEMKAILYEHVIENEEKQIEKLELVEAIHITFPMNLENEDIANLFKMTPYYYKSSKQASDRLLAERNLSCTAGFVIYKYQKKSVSRI